MLPDEFSDPALSHNSYCRTLETNHRSDPHVFQALQAWRIVKVPGPFRYSCWGIPISRWAGSGCIRSHSMASEQRLAGTVCNKWITALRSAASTCGAAPRFILTQGHIAHVVALVLDAPMGPHQAQKCSRVGPLDRPAGDPVHHLHGGHTLDRPGAGDAEPVLQSGPPIVARQQRGGPHGPRLDPPVPRVHRRGRAPQLLGRRDRLRGTWPPRALGRRPRTPTRPRCRPPGRVGCPWP
ncbi:hypothetical protein GobsT_46010 [Gemmata obscuriglobus]|nr:hypothetical protein GobsT_46010 [Gemmata obscuriglobus]VTS09120.1 unnamed protein product [Gemmata obscuriglobus UQM 2246]